MFRTLYDAFLFTLNSSLLSSAVSKQHVGDMEFSEVMVGQKVVLSPDGTMIAAVDKYNLLIRDALSLGLIARFTCLDAITQALWSPDSAFILCAQSKRRIVQVWSVHDPDWYCKIDESVAGIANTMWSPDSRHILTVSEFQVGTRNVIAAKPSVLYLVLRLCCHVLRRVDHHTPPTHSPSSFFSALLRPFFRIFCNPIVSYESLSGPFPTSLSVTSSSPSIPPKELSFRQTARCVFPTFIGCELCSGIMDCIDCIF